MQVSGQTARDSCEENGGSIDMSSPSLEVLKGPCALIEPCSLAWIKSARWPEAHAGGRKLRFVDLFSGCGGLTLGVIEACRILAMEPEIVLAAEYEQTMLRVYEANFEPWLRKTWQKDIQRELPGRLGSRPKGTEARVSSLEGTLDLLVAGPPCQGHSDLNNKTRRNDPRNSLYLRAVRFAELARPTAVVIENVPTAIHDLERVVDVAESTFQEAGYATENLTINTGALGLAQVRRRHLLIARPATWKPVGDAIQSKHKLPATLRDYIGDLENEWRERFDLFAQPSRMMEQNRHRAEFLFSRNLFDLPDSERPACHRDKKHSYRSAYGRLRWDEPAQTLTSGFGSMGQGRYLHPSQRRVITPHEAARIQGFPDFFDFSSVERRIALHTMIGNAVPPLLAASVILALFAGAKSKGSDLLGSLTQADC